MEPDYALSTVVSLENVLLEVTVDDANKTLWQNRSEVGNKPTKKKI